jgi:AcrR family transcriptional regulator
MLLFTSRLTMVAMVNRLVNRNPIQTNPDACAGASAIAPARRRMGVAERERQILDGAIQFFALHGFDGQLRDLARSIGVTHALLYHYFPTKQALVDRVYLEVFEGRWNPEWEAWLDDPNVEPEDKLTRFYHDYINTTLTHDFVRILVFSGLTDRTITDRFFGLLRERLFPRLIRETRLFRQLKSRARPSQRERELLMGLHGGFFYISMRRWIYGQVVHSDEAPGTYFDEALVRDRVRGYLLSSRELFAPAPQSAATRPRKAVGH